MVLNEELQLRSLVRSQFAELYTRLSLLQWHCGVFVDGQIPHTLTGHTVQTKNTVCHKELQLSGLNGWLFRGYIFKHESTHANIYQSTGSGVTGLEYDECTFLDTKSLVLPSFNFGFGVCHSQAFPQQLCDSLNQDKLLQARYVPHGLIFGECKRRGRLQDRNPGGKASFVAGYCPIEGRQLERLR